MSASPVAGVATYDIQLTYRYSYTAPVTNLRQRLVVIPPDAHGDQRLVDYRLDTRGADLFVLTWDRDAFGNRVAIVTADRVERAITFEASFRVECPLEGATGDAHLRRGALAGDRYLRPTALTAPDARLRAAAREIAAHGSDRDRAERALAWAADAIHYHKGVTDVHTPAAMALYLGKGVCQDYAHIMLCLLRLLDVPARYVSGHLMGEGAPHAWVEALLDDPDSDNGVDIAAYDPTHRRRTGPGYVTVAVGRDFADVTPTSGAFTGPAIGTLTASKRAALVTAGDRTDR